MDSEAALDLVIDELTKAERLLVGDLLMAIGGEDREARLRRHIEWERKLAHRREVHAAQMRRWRERREQG